MVWWLAATVAPAADCVVLLHGLARTSGSMDDMAAALRAEGYHTENIDYPSREHPIEVLAPEAVMRGVRGCRAHDAQTIHFVTHSLGGILVRHFLAHRPLPELGRVVMLSPPNRGSEVADRLADDAWYRWLNGPAGQQLGTGARSVPLALGPVDYPVGVITGDRQAWFDAWLADMFPGPNDGKVSVARARVEGMQDFLVLPYSHPFIMQAGPVIEQVVHFLRAGRFAEE
jgi:pimeloyl-ACP methyl ester carboxylesterase